MNYKGVIIEESLGDKDVLKMVKITKTEVEPITKEHKTPWLKQWTLHTIEIPQNKAYEVAKKISTSFDPQYLKWYADFKNQKFHYIVYANKVFKVDLDNPVLYKEAREHGITLGIPEYQVDFAPDDKLWER